MKINQSLRVAIDAEAMERIWQWTALATGEFSCLAQVTPELRVHGAELFDQVNTAASTELDQAALAKFLCRHDKPEAVRAWIHSHGDLGVFWSEQDEACIAGLANESFLVSIVVNKRHQAKCRLDVFAPVRLTVDEVELEVRAPSLDLRTECERLFKQHVREAPLRPRLGTLLPANQPTPQRLMNVYHGWPATDDEEDFGHWR
ncbi:MAG: hypothetical protein HY902_21050 [Deltaproteobacteria bacterium]|nr:hypothetical protein [Deltaproteobacteria bacterium]